MNCSLINYSKAIYDPIINFTRKNGKIWLEMESEAPGIDIFFTIDDTMPDHYSILYTKPFEIPEGPITLRIIAYRDGKPLGHLITLNPAEIKKRSGK